jgi:DNA-directed RNA polymerase specialized sigma24 family protein
MPTAHTSLPPPYDALLAPADLARYGAALPARQAEALRLRCLGFLYAQVGNRLGVSTVMARALVRQACERLYQAKQRAELLP